MLARIHPTTLHVVLSSMLHDPVMEFYEVPGARSIRDRASELPRTPLLGTRVNRGQEKGPEQSRPGPLLLSYLPEIQTPRCCGQGYWVAYRGSGTILVGQGCIIDRGRIALTCSRPCRERHLVEEVVPGQHRKRSVVQNEPRRAIREIFGTRPRYADILKRDIAWTVVRHSYVLGSCTPKHVGRTEVQRSRRYRYSGSSLVHCPSATGRGGIGPRGGIDRPDLEGVRAVDQARVVLGRGAPGEGYTVEAALEGRT